jgi:hypothetical protein
MPLALAEPDPFTLANLTTKSLTAERVMLASSLLPLREKVPGGARRMRGVGSIDFVRR